MKLRCIGNEETAGIYSKKTKILKGLTIGKVYEGCLGSDSYPYRFMVFNDFNRWRCYEISLFEPADI